jgi:hypothetical protein
MRTEFEIQNRILIIIDEIRDITANAHRDNPLMFGDEVRRQLRLLNELGDLHWVLDEPVPKTLLDVLL